MARLRIPLARHTSSRDGAFYLRFRVPLAVREAFGGQAAVWRTTGTSDHAAALIAAAPILAKLKNRVARAQALLREGSGIAGMAAEWRKLKDDGRREDTNALALNLQVAIAEAAPADAHDTAAMAQQSATRDAAVRAAAKFVPGGYKAVQRVVMFDDRFEGDEASAVAILGGEKAQNFLKIAIGGQKPTTAFVASWHEQRAKEVEARTMAMDKSDVEEFARSHPTLDAINKRAVVSWVDGLRSGKTPLSPKTIQRKLSALRSFWKRLQAIGVVSDEVHPFTGIEVKERSKGAVKRRREAFTPAEIAALYKAAKDKEDNVLADLIHMAAYTGARIEELCQLKADDVVVSAGGTRLKIDDAKTDAGNRMVPIHAALKGTVERLVKSSGGGFLLNVSSKNKYEERSAGIGKKFGRLARKMKHPSTKVFHSIRRTVVSQLDDAGIQPHVQAALVGHERKDFTGSKYSDAELRKLVKKAVDVLRYPAPLAAP